MTVRHPARPPLKLAAVGALALGTLTACGAGSVDSGELETQVSDQLAQQVGQEPERLECPENLEAEEGTTTTCLLTADGTEFNVAVEVTSVDGNEVNFSIEVAQEPNN